MHSGKEIDATPRSFCLAPQRCEKEARVPIPNGCYQSNLEQTSIPIPREYLTLVEADPLALTNDKHAIRNIIWHALHHLSVAVVMLIKID